MGGIDTKYDNVISISFSPSLRHRVYLGPVGHPLGQAVADDDVNKGNFPVFGNQVREGVPLDLGAVVPEQPDVHKATRAGDAARRVVGHVVEELLVLGTGCGVEEDN
jgi:hypothetical protein